MQELDKILEQGESLIARGAAEEGLRLFQTVLDHDGGNRTARNNKGVALYCLGRLQEARAVFQQLLQEQPDDGGAAANLIATCLTAGEDAEARRHLGRYCWILDENDLQNFSVLWGPAGGEEEAEDLRFDYGKTAGEIGRLAGQEIFFVMGMPKSGTTWLQYLLNAHPQIWCSGESNFNMLHDPLRDLLNQYNRLTTANNAGIGSKDFLQFGRQELYFLFASAILVLLAGRPEGREVRRVGVKAPMVLHALDLYQQLFPNSRYIHIIRDGRDVALSAWHNNRRNDPAFAAENPDFHRWLEETAPSWVNNIRKGRRFGRLHPHRYCEVRYEDLHARPVEELGRLFAFLGVDNASTVASTCCEAADFRRLSGGRQPGEEDPSSFFRKGIIGDWKNVFDERASQIFMAHGGDMLRELAYA